MDFAIEPVIEFLTGPRGGTFALGLLIGYIICSKTILKETKERLDKAEQEIRDIRASMTEQLNDLRSKYEAELRTPSIPAHMIPNNTAELL